QGISQLTTLFSEPGMQTNVLVQATDQPALQPHSLSYYDSYEQAFNLNPDYLSRRKQIQQENIRVAFAKNQRLPQLDLKASYGLNGLGTSPGEAWEDVSHSDFPSWSVGLEMRIPVTGGIRERNELAAARLAKQKALLGLKEIEVQIANALESALTKVRSLRDNVQSYQSVVDFHQQLLQSQLERLEVGRVDSRAVLETEEKLFEAKLAVLDSLVQYQKALVELELVSGATLQTHNLDLSKAQLESKTAALSKERNWSPPALERFAREAEKADPFGNMSPANLDQRRALERLHQEMAPPTYPPLTPEERQKAVEALRREMPSRAVPSLTPEERQKALEILRQKIKETP
ncbi:MAG: TolC family protein, partial [Verrucomicrobiales bacterium]|nr:TolC family protein [Verrucomicrobiales bacterium]